MIAVAAEVFHANRPPGKARLIAGFRNFAKAPKKGKEFHAL
jgi:hypothetical protein